MPNDPYLDASVRWKIASGNAAFHELRESESVAALLDAGLVTEVLARIGSGKEADVYLARDGPNPIAVKVYRYYRSSHRGGRPIKAESTGHLAAHEIEMLTRAYQGEARVPRPGRRIENAFTMQYLGDEDGPSPLLSTVGLEDAEIWRDRVVENVHTLARAGVVHVDLSPFNVLAHEGQPYVIDFGECLRVDRLGSAPWMRLTAAKTALERSLQAFDRYFRRYGARIDVTAEVGTLIASLDRFGVFE
ncbi:MAG: RIO1 family regulatory kinase/ATPase [Thermoplasmata archaeon]